MRRFLVFCNKLRNQYSSTDKWNLELCRLILESIAFILFSGFLILDIDKFWQLYIRIWRLDFIFQIHFRHFYSLAMRL